MINTVNAKTDNWEMSEPTYHGIKYKPYQHALQPIPGFSFNTDTRSINPSLILVTTETYEFREVSEYEILNAVVLYEDELRSPFPKERKIKMRIIGKEKVKPGFIGEME